MATQIVPAPERADHTRTAPLSPVAEHAMRRLELALADRVVANFDHWGTVWGFSTIAEADAENVESLAEGATVEEWETVDRDAQPLRVVRVDHPKWGTDIRVTSTWPTGKAAR